MDTQIPQQQPDLASQTGSEDPGFANVQDVLGDLHSLPINQTQDAISSGRYTLANPKDVADYKHEQQFSTPGQMAATAAEGATSGVIGETAQTGLETGLGISTPENILARKEVNPGIHGVSQLLGFGAGAYASAGIAPGLGLLGDVAVGAVGLGDAAGISAKIAAGAVRAGTEMMALQADNEGAKAILNVPDSIGDAIVNVGMSGLIGAGTGGTLSGIGALGSSAIEKIGGSGFINDLKNTLSSRASGINPSEAVGNDIKQNIDFFHNTATEMGVENLTSKALSGIMPEDVTPEITNQVLDTVQKAKEANKLMKSRFVPDYLRQGYKEVTNKFMDFAANQDLPPDQYFDALNVYKRDLQGLVKGKWGDIKVDATDPAANFINIIKGLSNNLKEGLEDPEVWGKPVADLQSGINAAWHEAIPAVKQIEKAYTGKVGNLRVPNIDAIDKLMNEAGEITSPSIRQQRIGNFVSAIKEFGDKVTNIYEKSGLSAPEIPSMSNVSEALKKPSAGTRLGNAWYDKVGKNAAGESLGAGIGALAGHAVFPGIGTIAGGYLGKTLLGPPLGAVIKPVLESAASSAAFKQAIGFGENVLKGDGIIKKAAKGIFDGSFVIPPGIFPDKEKTEELDKHLKDYSMNPKKLLDVSGSLGHYMPNHAAAFAATAQKAVNIADMARPHNPQMNPLDAKIPLSNQQKSEWNRSLEIMQQPLMAMKHIKDGDLLPKDVAIMHGLYPDTYTKISQHLHNEMIEHISKGENVPYKLRQSLSIFFGQPLDSTFTQPSIMAAQMTFIPKAAPPPPPGQQKSKKGTSKLGDMAKNMETSSESREARKNKA